MGVEARSLYTADVTRTLPVDGTFTPLQRELYDLVHAAQEAGIQAVRPGVPFLAAHDAAMEVLAHGLEDMGLLPVSAEEALDPDSKVYARWTLHGTSHMLGLDVHDCGQASDDAYRHGTLAEGMSSPSSRVSTSRRTTCSSPRSCAASASGSRTTSSSPPTASATSPPRSPAPRATSRSGWAGSAADGPACRHGARAQAPGRFQIPKALGRPPTYGTSSGQCRVSTSTIVFFSTHASPSRV